MMMHQSLLLMYLQNLHIICTSPLHDHICLILSMSTFAYTDRAETNKAHRQS